MSSLRKNVLALLVKRILALTVAYVQDHTHVHKMSTGRLVSCVSRRLIDFQRHMHVGTQMMSYSKNKLFLVL